jgi:hypothetical protein
METFTRRDSDDELLDYLVREDEEAESNELGYDSDDDYTFAQIKEIFPVGSGKFLDDYMFPLNMAPKYARAYIKMVCVYCQNKFFNAIDLGLARTWNDLTKKEQNEQHNWYSDRLEKILNEQSRYGLALLWFMVYEEFNGNPFNSITQRDVYFYEVREKMIESNLNSTNSQLEKY